MMLIKGNQRDKDYQAYKKLVLILNIYQKDSYKIPALCKKTKRERHIIYLS